MLFGSVLYLLVRKPKEDTQCSPCWGEVEASRKVTVENRPSSVTQHRRDTGMHKFATLGTPALPHIAQRPTVMRSPCHHEQGGGVLTKIPLLFVQCGLSWAFAYISVPLFF